MKPQSVLGLGKVHSSPGKLIARAADSRLVRTVEGTEGSSLGVKMLQFPYPGPLPRGERGKREATRCGLKRFAAGLVLALMAGAWTDLSLAHKAKAEARLPSIGPAPEFLLATQDGTRLALSDHRGQAVVVTFLYTSCTDTCPMLTAKLIGIQRRVPARLQPKAYFIAITVDPERDTTEVLKQYAQAHGADLGHWAFLTGTAAEIDDVARRYGIYRKKQTGGDVDHTFLTSLIDRSGTLRVQYLGWRFDPKEFLTDLQSLAKEPAPR
jgi:protein SCO1